MFTILRSSWALHVWAIGALLISIFGQDQLERRCTLLKFTNRSGFITSPPMFSEATCVYYQFQIRRADTLTISFDYLDLGSMENCENTYLKIGPINEHKICGTDSSPIITRVKQGGAWMYYQRDNSQANSFRFHYIAGNVPEQDFCRPGEWMCGNGKCILGQWRCNNRYECVDHSDEAQCFPETSTTHSCSRYEYQCNDLNCVPASSRCDGYNDCVDASDERFCTSEPAISTNCGRGQYRCSNNMCIAEKLRCNGYSDCTDSSDELSCNTDVLPTRRTGKPIIEEPACQPGGVQLRSRYGYISSPGFPSTYLQNKHCSWQITNYHNKIKLRFTYFHLQKKEGTDYVSVYDGPNANSPLLGTYFGTDTPPVLQSTFYQLFVVFHTDGSVADIGFNATFQQKGYCLPDQLHCDQEAECYFRSDKCDGFWDCPEHGSDELNCNECKNKYSCGIGYKCYEDSERCNGKSFCLNNADELNCTAKRCGPQNGLFLCRNKRCIYESWECDRTSDCDDHSDEDDCPSPFFTRRVIVAAVAGSLICSLLLVIALGCICKVYALRMHEQYGPRHESPLSRLQAEFFRRRAPPPPYHEAMLTSRPYEEARREYLNQSRDQRRRRASDRRRNRTLPPTPEEPSMHQIVNDSGDLEQGGGNDVQLLSMNSTNEQNAMTDTSSTTQLIPPSTSSDSEENQAYDNDAMCNGGGGQEDDDNDSVLLDLSDGIGGTVTWRSRLASDEEHSPDHAPSEVGCDSLDSASASISVDDMSLAIDETLEKENGVEAEIVDKNCTSSQGTSSVPAESSSTVDTQIKNQ